LDQDLVVEQLKQCLRERIDAKCRKIRIVLGEEVPVEPLIDAVRATFLADGTQPYVFAKKQKKKDTVVRIRRAVEEDTTNAPVFVAMRDVFAKEAERLAQGEDGQAGQDDDDDDDDSGEGNEGGKQPGADGDSADEAAGSTIMWVPMKGKAVKKTKLPKRLVRRLQAKAKAATATAADTAAAFSLAQVGGAPANESDSPDDSAAVQAEEDGTNDANDMNVTEPFRWKAHLLGLFGVVGGLEKLCRDRPSTGYFGNWGIIEACKRVSRRPESTGCIKASAFMGKAARGSTCAIQAANKDKASTIGKQWIQFREAFGRQDAALLFHLTNHYALIYAVREWTNTDGTAVRQILTTRRGQRPTVWMDWAEVRDIVIKWAGYKVIIVERGSADTWA